MKTVELNQTTPYILMVRPAMFGYNEQTATNNAFQQNDQSVSKIDIRLQAEKEFDAFVQKLRAEDIDVLVAQDSKTPAKPDAVFPNNWISFHPNGTVILYPMYAESRRIERSKDILNLIEDNFRVRETIDISKYEQENLFLEGTGSMIFDRPNSLVYACISPRTNMQLLDRFCGFVDYKKVAFDALDENGQAIYHTNVMMAMGDQFVVICMDTIQNKEERAMLENRFKETNKVIIDISLEQMQSFAGNMLQVANKKGETYLVMSEQAFKCLTTTQIEKIESYTKILHSPIYTIEKYGGGSARCMMAEIFLPKK